MLTPTHELNGAMSSIVAAVERLTALEIAHTWSLVGRRSKLNRQGETEAGNAGEQPCLGITLWAHRVDEAGGVRAALPDAPAPQSDAKTLSNDRHPYLENPRREEAELSSLPRTTTLDFRLNQDSPEEPVTG
jgi:hypothetical protein